MKNIISITVLILLLGSAQASWRRFRHHSFRPQGYDLLQTEAQTETKTETEATLTTSVSSGTDCEPDCLYKYPYIEGDCSDHKEAPTSIGQPEQPEQPPQVPTQPEETYSGEPLQNEEGVFVLEREECYQFNEPQVVTESTNQWQNEGEVIVPPPQNEQWGSPSEQLPSLPPQNQGEPTPSGPVTSPFPVPEEESDEQPSSVYRYPFANAGAGCPVVSENVEEALISGTEPEVGTNWQEIPSNQSREVPQYPGDEQIPSEAPPVGPQGFPQYPGGEQIPSEVPPVNPQDFPQDKQGEQVPGYAEQVYTPEQPSGIVVVDIPSQYVPQEGQSEQITGDQQECGRPVIESRSDAPQGEEVPFEGQGVVNYDDAVYIPLQPQPQEQEQAPAQPEFKPEVPMYPPSYGPGATCSCVCGYGDNAFSYSFKM